MRLYWAACAVLLCCQMPNQVIQSPCVDMAVTGNLGVCPQCTTDSDCELLSNPCEPFAYCVHKDSSWQVNMNATCDDTQKYHPTLQSCLCLAGKCDWSNRRSR